MMMTTNEARAWLSGERSMINLFMETCTENENANLITMQADAAMMQQSYWVLLADKAGLVNPSAEHEPRRGTSRSAPCSCSEVV